ncbi:MAG TPA: SDR family oxidoreductase [Planctomycetota bacterium]|nr:SDR family oxidoreductase [Planctomycetota bacterium]
MPVTKPPKKARPSITEALEQAAVPIDPVLAAVVEPRTEPQPQRSGGRLDGQVALITGGDSGIGRAVAVRFAREGADIAFVHRDRAEDAYETARLVEAAGRRCLVIAGDVGDEQVCREAVLRTVNHYERLDVLVNAALEQHPQDDLLHISEEQLARTFRGQVFSAAFMAKAVLPHLDRGASIINTTSVAAYRGAARLMDHAAACGAIVALTRSLALALAAVGVRVNAVAPDSAALAGDEPGLPDPRVSAPPRIVASGSAAMLLDPAQATGTGALPASTPQPATDPDAIAGCYVFLASGDAAFLTGQVLHPNGGAIVNG